jgi:hypothetical protein
LLAVGPEQPFGRPGALPASLLGPDLDRPVGEGEGPHLDGARGVGLAVRAGQGVGAEREHSPTNADVARGVALLLAVRCVTGRGPPICRG